MKQFYLPYLAFIALYLSAALPVLAEHDINIPEFRAKYDVEKSGFDAIRTTMSLNRKNDLWQITSESEPVGIVSLFAGDQEVTEQSTFSIDENDSLVPQEYSYRHKGSNKNRNQHYSFTWPEERVAINYRGEKKTLPLKKGTLDSFSAQFALIRDARKECDEYSYSVISKGRLKTYQYVKLKNETIDTALGRLDTIKLQRRKDDEEQTTYTTWHAPDLHYIPVKIVKEENGKVELAMRLQKITWQNDSN